MTEMLKINFLDPIHKKAEAFFEKEGMPFGGTADDLDKALSYISGKKGLTITKKITLKDGREVEVTDKAATLKEIPKWLIVYRYFDISRSCKNFILALEYAGFEVNEIYYEDSKFPDVMVTIPKIETITDDAGHVIDVKASEKKCVLNVLSSDIDKLMKEPLYEFLVGKDKWKILSTTYAARTATYIPRAENVAELFDLGFARFKSDSKAGRLSLTVGEVSELKKQLRKEKRELNNFAFNGDPEYFMYCDDDPSHDRDREMEEAAAEPVAVFDDNARLQSVVANVVKTVWQGEVPRELSILLNWKVNTLGYDEIKKISRNLGTTPKETCKAFRYALSENKLSLTEFFDLTGMSAEDFKDYVDGQAWFVSENPNSIDFDEKFVKSIERLVELTMTKEFFAISEEQKAEMREKDKAQFDGLVAELLGN